jgi:broad specificity phosphatase PhoE
MTVAVLSSHIDVPVVVDDRLVERMNWSGEGQSLDDFLVEWHRATVERDYVPSCGEASRTAGARFENLLREVAVCHPGQIVVLVSHGGVTVDMLRKVLGDDALQAGRRTSSDGASLVVPGPSSSVKGQTFHRICRTSGGLTQLVGSRG